MSAVSLIVGLNLSPWPQNMTAPRIVASNASPNLGTQNERKLSDAIPPFRVG